MWTTTSAPSITGTGPARISAPTLKEAMNVHAGRVLPWQRMDILVKAVMAVTSTMEAVLTSALIVTVRCFVYVLKDFLWLLTGKFAKILMNV